MERQALRDAVLRYNTEDLAGLRDHPKGRPQRRLTEGEEAALAAVILRGPEPNRDGCCAWTRADLCHWIAAHFGKSYHPFEHDAGAAPNGVLAPEGAPRAPEARRKSPGALRKKGLRAALKAAAAAHPGKHLQLWFQMLWRRTPPELTIQTGRRPQPEQGACHHAVRKHRLCRNRT
jgi:hypothetical protein